jgi:hypothetical protein
MKKILFLGFLLSAAVATTTMARDVGPPTEQQKVMISEVTYESTPILFLAHAEATAIVIVEKTPVFAVPVSKSTAFHATWRQIQSEYGLRNERLPQKIDKKQYILRSGWARNVTLA